MTNVRSYDERILNIKIQYCHNRSRNTIGSVIFDKDYYWSSINLKIVEMSSLDLSTQLMVEEIDETQTRSTSKTKGSPPKQFSLLPSSGSFSRVLILSLCARTCAFCLWGCLPQKALLLKERAVRTRGYIYIHIYRPSLYLALSFLIFHKQLPHRKPEDIASHMVSKPWISNI